MQRANSANKREKVQKENAPVARRTENLRDVEQTQRNRAKHHHLPRRRARQLAQVRVRRS